MSEIDLDGLRFRFDPVAAYRGVFHVKVLSGDLIIPTNKIVSAELLHDPEPLRSWLRQQFGTKP